MKPKEYLLKHGHIDSIGRGRMSREHIAIIEKAVNEGVNIEGYSSNTAPEGGIEKTASKTEKPEFIGIADVGEPLRDEKSLSAHTFHNGEKVYVGMRTVCNTCGNSLTYCPCPNPVINLDYDLTGVVGFTESNQRG